VAATYRDPAERSYLRFFYRDWRPTRLGKLATGILAWVAGLGILPPVLLTLQVRGRRSGRLHSKILVVAEHEGQRYLVSMLGNHSEWVRNVRAAGGDAIVKRGRSRPVRLTEIPAKERGPILKEYCRVATSGRHHIPVSYDAPVSEFDAAAERYPVFRIDPA
jgi:deazaflavin-dependent oxidoreductase (nitroreductase family)